MYNLNYNFKGYFMLNFKPVYEPADKIVPLFNEFVIIPAWSKYIAVDKFGDVYSFVEKPYEDDGRWCSDGSSKELIGTVSPFPEWENSLIEL